MSAAESRKSFPLWARIVLWLLFAWALLMCVVILYSRPFSEIEYSLRPLLLSAGLRLGLPSWIGLPIMLLAFRQHFRAKHFALFLLPHAFAALCWWVHPIAQLREGM